MKLYIEIKNELPINHPAFEENLLQAFGEVPDHWVPFERIERPQLGVYDVFDPEEPVYQVVDGVYKDVWMVRPMTVEEIATKKTDVIAAWGDYYPSWIFNEDKCVFEPPIAKPQDEKHYYWDESSINWVEIT